MKSICLIAFSRISRDARVQRQIQYLASNYHLSVIGYDRPDKQSANVDWRILAEPRSSWATKMATGILLLLGRIWPRFYEIWFWRKREHRHALQKARKASADYVHANDWQALPIAVATGAKVVFDAHEYAPLEWENRRFWKTLHTPMISYFLHRYAQHAAASVTVGPLIAQRYGREFGFTPIVVMNAGAPGNSVSHSQSTEIINLIHHGTALPDRQLESMIETMRFAGERFVLNFMLVGNQDYISRLKVSADSLVPGRVVFHEPVDTGEVIDRIAQFDLGFYLLAPNSFNNFVALPNKFFDFIAAGLAVCVGPSPEMATIIKKFGIGVVAPSFEPRDAGATLNDIDIQKVRAFQAAAGRARLQLNAETEMRKLTAIYDRLSGEAG